MFSNNEEKLLKLLGRRKIKILTLADIYYGNENIIDANNRVASMIRRINRRCDMHGLPWKINGYGGGRGGRTVWKEVERKRT